MARTIAEILAYKRNYSPELNPIIFDEDGIMHPDVHNKIIEIVDAFLDYTQVKDDVKVYDIRVVGSNASYNYNENSDLDIHIVTDLSKISKPESIAQLYFGEVKHAFKESYDITIKGIDVEMYVEDINASAVTNGIYSVTKDKWIKEPEQMDDPTESELSQAEAIEDDIISKLESATDEEKNDIIDQLYVMRKDALSNQGETAPANLAFKSLRNKGIIKRAKDEVSKAVSKRLSLESRKMRKLKEDLEEAITLDTKQDLIDYLKNVHIEKYKEYAVCTNDNYDFYMLWSRNRYDTKEYPIIQIDYNEETIFHQIGSSDSDDLLQQAINRLESMNESRKRVHEMSRTPNKYWIYTEDYSFMKKDERERADFLYDSDNTSAYGVDDLIYKLNQLKDRDIKVKKIYQSYKNETSLDVTDKFREYLL